MPPAAPPALARAETGADLQQWLLDGLPLPAGLVDGRGRLLLANAALGHRLGEGAVPGTELAAHWAADSRPAWQAACIEAAGGAPARCVLWLAGAAGGADMATPEGTTAVEAELRRAAPGRADLLVLCLHQPAPVAGTPDPMLQWIARATAPLTGQDFFRTLMRHLAEAFGFRRAFIAECVDHPTTRVRTLAFWSDACFRDDFEFELAGTPCEMTIRDGRVFCVDNDLQARYAWARRQLLDSYLGAPIFDSQGERLIGHVAFETSGHIDRSVLEHPLFQIFVSRAAAELRRKRAEDVLRASEANYRLLVEHQSDVILKLDAGQRLLFASPSFCRLFGRDEADLLGRPFRPIVADEDHGRFEAAWAALLAPPHESHFEERVQTIEGWRCIAWSQKAMVGPGPGGEPVLHAVVAVGRDVTERRRAEQQGRAHLQQLARVGRVSALGEMASAIAHEINQPLTALRTYAQASQRLLAGGAAPAELDDTLARIAAQAERAGEIIRRLRGFLARDEVRTLPVAPNFIVQEVIGLAQADAAQCGVQLIADLAPGLPAVDVDCIQIEQVLLNLVRNAIDALQWPLPDTPAAAEPPPRRVWLRTRSEGNAVCLAVQDNGPGVPAELAPTVFDPFVSHKPGGMGIGLTISRSIAEAHRGRLDLVAADGGGACFVLQLPALPE